MRQATSKWGVDVLHQGRHELWRGVSADHKQIIRSFMIHFHTAVLTAASEQPGPNGEAVKAFCFHRGSVGNFFFSGCRKFFNSLSAAITLWSSLVGIPHETAVLPIINSNHTVTIGAQLEDGSKIFGQNQISHPGDVVDKQHQGQQPLPARIRRLFYLNDWRQEIEFHADPSVLSTLSHAAMVVYSMGSLYTSICASLATKGVGDHIATLACPKVLILNGTVDRETHGMTAMDFVWAIVHACVGSSRHNANQRTAKQDDAALVSQFVTHVLYLTTSEVPMDGGRLEELGLRVIPISEHAASNPQHYRTRALVSAILDILPPDRGSS
ncbi:hypothetical protein PTSG_08021 [Salpingoeca rosetta]|uniref:Uncharacterized protein n=1 Tax=Salpingoeca rosetta (strain ATCC 50818 / BSB-021) TaxID=946362 RepID=F2UHS2_SALR5|nr:uncharacterized protein PTSG_08021 [Salpingoeca rosetta]EGD76671.1 hypothetical protein PTSG_08021 [Salpingoeca rosetta]|eukprot:XP_004991043.1 hypothetical protein PTSG_08021 [Salpingoeca rosetta]